MPCRGMPRAASPPTPQVSILYWRCALALRVAVETRLAMRFQFSIGDAATEVPPYAVGILLLFQFSIGDAKDEREELTQTLHNCFNSLLEMLVFSRL